MKSPQHRSATLKVWTKNSACATTDSASTVLVQRFSIPACADRLTRAFDRLVGSISANDRETNHRGSAAFGDDVSAQGRSESGGSATRKSAA
jgi:hypothetical protein